jgi:hypothetical protein
MVSSGLGAPALSVTWMLGLHMPRALRGLALPQSSPTAL